MTDTTVETEIDWGPWGRPLFDDDIAKGLSRVGVIDVGSNSVRRTAFRSRLPVDASCGPISISPSQASQSAAMMGSGGCMGSESRPKHWRLR